MERPGGRLRAFQPRMLNRRFFIIISFRGVLWARSSGDGLRRCAAVLPVQAQVVNCSTNAFHKAKRKSCGHGSQVLGRGSALDGSEGALTLDIMHSCSRLYGFPAVPDFRPLIPDIWLLPPLVPPTSSGLEPLARAARLPGLLHPAFPPSLLHLPSTLIPAAAATVRVHEHWRRRLALAGGTSDLTTRTPSACRSCERGCRLPECQSNSIVNSTCQARSKLLQCPSDAFL
jgi:hypothetical protein